MAKTNYGEMEKSISRTLKKYKRDELLVQADEAQKELKSKKKNETRRKEATTKKERVQATKEEVKEKAFDAIKKKLSMLNNRSKRVLFEKLNLNKEELKKYISDHNKLSREDWKMIKQIQKQISTYSENIENFEQEFNDKIINSEKNKHVNKRLNVRDNWLPL
ncbi:MAG: hypothetical protein HN411_00275 [Waddliaceae bacterium]|jgi:hypothetical protein|nr:hypothetical protein [Waddliaceae bacterium]MBT3578404.1 hypothetical protein [Waddliaceae bacterium]MBT4445290.1 hypothetical protein [Waddliaceae bacterium]MBT6928876.1 hypothetical protein [Waddliaceae bacterium]MBT7263944.1 hypothetical protein [Waddliaceae bacterium]